MDIIIREYKHTDYSALIALLNKVYDSEIDKKVLENKYITNDRSILIASTNENVLVGCAFIEVQHDYIRPSRVIYVTYVAVDEAYREHGIGRKLFKSIEELCREKECSAIELTSANFRTGAHSFYEAIGFNKKKTTVFIREID